jgi:hypothetical protein
MDSEFLFLHRNSFFSPAKLFNLFKLLIKLLIIVIFCKMFEVQAQSCFSRDFQVRIGAFQAATSGHTLPTCPGTQRQTVKSSLCLAN